MEDEMGEGLLSSKIIAGLILEREDLKLTHPVKYLCPYSGPKNGILLLTNFRVIFVSQKKVVFLDEKQIQHPISYVFATDDDPCYSIKVYNGSIRKILKSTVNCVKNVSITMDCIELICYDGRFIRFAYNVSNNQKGRTFMEKFDSCIFPLSREEKYPAFTYCMKPDIVGWSLYSIEKYFETLPNRDKLWKLTSANSSYELCNSYPADLIIPTNITDDELKILSKIFCGKRFPVLSWRHPKNYSSLIRMAAYVGNDSESIDVLSKYIKEVLENTPLSTEIYFFDGRNRTFNTYEIELNEKMIKKIEMLTKTMAIPNIHIIRESYDKLCSLCFPGDDDANFHSNVIETQWLEHIWTILSGVSEIVDTICRKYSTVIMYCSDAIDKTPQVTSLAMICMDPYYRTIKGFEDLIEREWVLMGFTFSSRLQTCEDKFNNDLRSPVFFQFIECVSVIIRQIPNAFEYNEYFLIDIIDGAMSSMYGTFLFDCDEQRTRENTKSSTISFWTFLNSKLDHYKNMLFHPEFYNSIILPDVFPPCIKFWQKFYMRHHPSASFPNQTKRLNHALSRKIEILSTSKI